VNTWVALEPLSATVEAGGEAVVSLRIRNTSDIVEEYQVDVVGDPALWCTPEPATLRLEPGTTGSVRLTFAPPRSPDAAAGPHPYGVRVGPVEMPDAVTVLEGDVAVAPFVDVRAELLPATVRGWRHAMPRLVVDNYGNTSVTATVLAAAPDDRVDFDIRTPSFQVSPGGAHLSVLKLRPARLLWLGRKISHPFTATVRPSGSEPVSVAATYAQTALLPAWLARVAMPLLGLAAVFAGLWFYAKPAVTSKATAEAQATTAPVAAIQTVPASPTPSRSPSPRHRKSRPKRVHATLPQSAPVQVAPISSPSPSKPQPRRTTPSTTHSSAVSLPAPTGFWTLYGDSGETAVDSVGTDTASGVDTGWCATKNCATFGGAADSAFTTAGPVLNTGAGRSFTVEASVWMSEIKPDGEFATAVSQDGNVNSGFYLQYSGANGCWAFARVTSDTSNAPGIRALGCGYSYDQTWTSLTGVFDASDDQLRLYVNGSLAGTATDPTPFAADGPLAIGRAQFNGSATDWFPGAMNNVEVFNTALTSAQVQLLYSKITS
jgi:hypothetical protein